MRGREGGEFAILVLNSRGVNRAEISGPARPAKIVLGTARPAINVL